MIAPTVLTRRTIATQIHLLAKTRRSTGRRYRSTRAITSSVIWTTVNTPRATRPHTGTEDNNESITYALSPRYLARHATSDGPSGRHGCIGQFVPPPNPRRLSATARPGEAQPKGGLLVVMGTGTERDPSTTSRLANGTVSAIRTSLTW